MNCCSVHYVLTADDCLRSRELCCSCRRVEPGDVLNIVLSVMEIQTYPGAASDYKVELVFHHEPENDNPASGGQRRSKYGKDEPVNLFVCSIVIRARGKREYAYSIRHHGCIISIRYHQAQNLAAVSAGPRYASGFTGRRMDGRGPSQNLNTV